jgi:hypothetical protein
LDFIFEHAMAMNVSAVRWWQWLALSVLVGVLLGGARLYWEGQSADPSAVTIGQVEFERLATASGDMRLRDITVYPARDGFHFVSARQGNGRHVVYAAPVEYRPKSPPTMAGKTLAFPEYLDRISVVYRYVWTYNWKMRLGIWLAASVAIIGVAWPLLLTLLIHLKLAPPRPVRQPVYNLERFSTEAAPLAREINPKELEKLRVLEAELERSIGAGAVHAPPTRPAQSSETSDADEGLLRPDERFSGTAGEPLVAAEQAKEDKAYAGTFYPTVAHAPKKPSKETE